MDLALNNLQRLICHKTHQTKPTNPQESGFQVEFIYEEPKKIKSNITDICYKNNKNNLNEPNNNNTTNNNVMYKRVVARKIRLTRRFTLFCLLNK